jgi:hypothetical protein
MMLEKLDDVEVIDPTKILGEGSYSAVYKVRSKKDNNVYALKKVALLDSD